MKAIVMLMWLFCTPAENIFIIINDILYKVPKNEITKIKTKYNIKAKDVITFKFDKSKCYAQTVEWLKIVVVEEETKETLKQYQVETTPFFIYEGKFVSMEYFHPSDVASVTLMPADEAISKFGCKGLNPIFIIMLQKGKTIQQKPVGGIMIKQQ